MNKNSQVVYEYQHIRIHKLFMNKDLQVRITVHKDSQGDHEYQHLSN